MHMGKYMDNSPDWEEYVHTCVIYMPQANCEGIVN